MLSRWIRSISDWAMNKSEQDLRASCTDPSAGVTARMQEAEAKAWWSRKTAAAGATVQPLLVIGPRAGADSVALAALGSSLREWQATRSYARHIWGSQRSARRASSANTSDLSVSPLLSRAQ